MITERKLYLTNNIEKYVIDSRGNFFHVDPDMLNDDRYYISKDIFTPEELEELRGKWVEKVIENKEDWEIICHKVHSEEGKGELSPDTIRNKKNNYTLPSNFPDYLKDKIGDWEFYLFGELGFRGWFWKDYDKRRERYIPKGRKNNKTSSEQSENQQQEAKQLEEERKKTEEEQKQNNPLSENTPLQNEPTNNENSTSPPNQSTNQELKDQDLKNLQNQETQSNYQENKEQINNLKKDQTTSNPQQYGEDITLLKVLNKN